MVREVSDMEWMVPPSNGPQPAAHILSSSSLSCSTGFAKGHVPTVGHDGEEKDLGAGKDLKEDHLGDTGLKEDELLF